ncbi:MAG TPA: PilZ domain-containing protein [Spirochaetia bacterium]|nr:PilZ domain-containing protein [Spirochaetia bacterium]
MCVPSRFETGRFFKLSFPLSAGRVFHVIGKVVWGRRTENGLNEYGVQFWDFEESKTAMLRHYLKELAEAAGDKPYGP